MACSLSRFHSAALMSLMDRMKEASDLSLLAILQDKAALHKRARRFYGWQTRRARLTER
jgi:hypothetical protein